MLNKVILMGRLTADPELKRTPSDVAVTAFTVAVNRNYAKEGTERQTDFIDVVCWRSTAEFVTKYFSKGKMIVVVGSLQVRPWKDKDGNNRRAVEVVAEEVSFGESKRDSDSPYQNAPHPAETYSNSDNSDDFRKLEDDDDLPF